MTQLSNPDIRRVRLAADGVVANYIHDISARTTTPPVARRNGDRPARLAHTRAALRGLTPAGSRRR
jgi:hypothetical protein